ncbi:MAG: hypothetical protein ACLUVG_05505 [Phocaeicola vulgatus]
MSTCRDAKAHYLHWQYLAEFFKQTSEIGLIRDYENFAADDIGLKQ